MEGSRQLKCTTAFKTKGGMDENAPDAAALNVLTISVALELHCCHTTSESVHPCFPAAQLKFRKFLSNTIFMCHFESVRACA